MGASPPKAQSAKIAEAVAPFATKDEKRNVLVQRYAEKWVRMRTGKRTSKPPIAGLDAKTRTKLQSVLDESFPPKAKAA